MSMSETFAEAAPTLKFGTVSAVDEAAMRVRVRLPELDNLRTQWLPVLTRKSKNDKDYWLPDEGEHVAVLLDAQGEDGVVLGAIFSGADPVPVASRDKWHRRFADGTTLEYDRAAHHLHVDCAGTITAIAKGSASVKAPDITLDTPQTTCTGNLTIQGLLTYEAGMVGKGGGGAAAAITGNVQVQGSVNASGDILAGGANSNHHSH
jgi:phage baseplate assembly protein V